MTLHTCSYHCDRPACIKAQRDELRDKMEKRIAEAIKSADKEEPVGEYKFDVASVTLTNKQLIRLGEIAFNFKEVPAFTIETSSDNGIGTAVVVKFSMFGKNDVTMDITDYKEW
jgi:hypothetical protein